jgi:tight adherence protein B
MRSALFDSAWGPLAVGLLVGCLMLLATLVVLAKPRGAWLRGRLEPYTPGAATAPGYDERGTPWRPSVHRLSDATERGLGRSGAWRWLSRLLERANVRSTPFDIVILSVGIGVAAAALTMLATDTTWLAVLVGLGGLVAPITWVALRARHRLSAFEEQLPDVLMTMAGSLRVGQSFNHSMQTIVDEGLAPASEEFARVLAETRLGSSTEEAVTRMADRIDSPDLRFVLMSVAIQREIGGSLAELFQTVSDTIRQRQQFRRRVHALTAMGRASAYVLVALPFATALLITLVHPGYLAPLFQTTAGQVMTVSMLAMIVIGGVVLRKIVTIKG